jgi:hypothetical protein
VVPFNRARADSLFSRAGRKLYEEQHAASVERDLTAVLNTTPNHSGAYLALAEFYHRRGNDAKEREVLERMLFQFDRHERAIAAIEDYLRKTDRAGRLGDYRDLLR